MPSYAISSNLFSHLFGAKRQLEALGMPGRLQAEFLFCFFQKKNSFWSWWCWSLEVAPFCCQTWWNTVFGVFAWVLRVCCWLSRAAWSLWLVLWTLEHLTRPETNGVRRVLWFDVEYQCCQYCTYCKHIIYMIRKIYRRNDMLFRFIQTDGIVTPFYPEALRILNPTGSKHRRVFQHCWNLIEHWTTCDFLPHPPIPSDSGLCILYHFMPCNDADAVPFFRRKSREHRTFYSWCQQKTCFCGFFQSRLRPDLTRFVEWLAHDTWSKVLNRQAAYVLGLRVPGQSYIEFHRIKQEKIR